MSVCVCVHGLVCVVWCGCVCGVVVCDAWCMFCSLNSEHDLRGAVPAQVKRLPIMPEQYFIIHDGVDADDLATVGFDFTEVFNIFEFGGDPSMLW